MKSAFVLPDDDYSSDQLLQELYRSFDVSLGSKPHKKQKAEIQNHELSHDSIQELLSLRTSYLSSMKSSKKRTKTTKKARN